jgi:hypothetical protein
MCSCYECYITRALLFYSITFKRNYSFLEGVKIFCPYGTGD